MESKLTNKQYISTVLPFIISSLTTPLLGAVDTAVVGQLSSPIYLAGVSIGVTIFNTIFWVFGFLSVSTTGQSAQSLGNSQKKIKAFIHPLVIAMVVSMFIIISKSPIWNIAMTILNPESNVQSQAKIYYDILIYASPLNLINYVIIGWLMGQSKIKISVAIQVSGNVLNVILDLLFVSILGMKVEGVAIATLISHIIVFIVGIIFVIKLGGVKVRYFFDKRFWDKKELTKELSNNGDLMIRSICLIIVTNMFMAMSTRLGTITLASNTILLQIESIIGYFFGGISSGASILTGKSIGENHKELVKDIVIITTKWSFYLIISISIIYIIYGKSIISLFTNIEDVLNEINKYYLWMIPITLFSSLPISYAGIFIGLLNAKPIRNSMIQSLIIFIILTSILIDNYKNNGLWFSYSIYYLVRSTVLIINIKNIVYSK